MAAGWEKHIEITQGADGATFRTGAGAPEDTLGNDGDIYFDTSTADLYQKVSGTWGTAIANLKGVQGTKGETGESGITPHIGENGNWFLGTTDTGYSALGKNGETPTLEINDEGFWVINGQVTEFNALCSHDEVYEQLENILEYDPTAFETSYTSVSSYDELSYDYNMSTFSGWGGSIGKPSEIDTIRFKVKCGDETRPSAATITEVKVFLTEESHTGTVLFETTLDVEIKFGEVEDLIVKLPEKIINTKNINYYFTYACNAPCERYMNYGAVIPETDNQVCMTYFTAGYIPNAISDNIKTHDSQIKYLPVEIGVVNPKFIISESTVKDIYSKMNEYAYKNQTLALPKTIYGYAGQTIQIYFNNISAYMIDDVYFRVTTNENKGVIYSDRWEYVPTAAETFDLTISCYTKDWELIEETVVSVVIKDTTTTTSANVIVIGDSTVNNGQEVGFMAAEDTADENFAINFLGTRAASNSIPHEGRSGWTAYKFVNSVNDSGDDTVTNPFYNSEISSFDFSYYMTQQGYESVDAVFIQLGINDMFGAKTEEQLEQSLTQFTTNLDIMVKSIHTYNPDIKVIVNLIIPCQLDQDRFANVYKAGQTSWTCKRNTYKANLLLLEKYANTSNVYLSWYNAAIDAYDNLSDDVHPISAGYEQLAKQMYNFLKAIS
ncbi:MAG: hypothetical protein IJW25_01565 [Clostridia bacterium]|nr:hypothetical protein [Clostridia bacterium]